MHGAMKYKIELENWFGEDRYCVYRKPVWTLAAWEYLSVFSTKEEAEKFIERLRDQKAL